MKFVEFRSEIPTPKEVFVLDRALRQGDKNLQVYVVGGAVRDYLYGRFHGIPTKKKDFDLTTELSEEEILGRLRSPMAEHLKIRVKEKQSVDTFGVVFASVNGGLAFEIAPFRRDVGSADGRHPERVERGTIHDDAMRRDFTINNLYYDYHRKVIMDFNPKAAGIEAIRQGRVQTVGDPFQRFEEDKLRVLRFLRFFSRFNPGFAYHAVDERTRQAIEHFRDLPGISAERIFVEFTQGIKQSLSTVSFLRNYADFGLFESVFPGMKVNIDGIYRLGNRKSIRVILAWLLHGNEGVGEKLTKLKYPNEISDPVQFLLDSEDFPVDRALSMVKNRDKREGSLADDLLLYSYVVESASVRRRLAHLSGYSAPVVSGEELMKRGFQGAAIGAEQRRIVAEDYSRSLENFEQ